MNRRALVVFLCWCGAGAPGTARASAGTAFLESARDRSLATAVVARPGHATSLVLAPASLADLTRPELSLSLSGARLEASFARTGEPIEDRGRWWGGFALGLGTPVATRGGWSHLRVGFALDLPAESALRVDVPEREDAPLSPVYHGRPDRIAAALGVAGDPLPWLRVGGGFTIVPTLRAPTDVTYAPGRTGDADRDVVVRLEREMEMGVVPFYGLRVDLGAGWSVGYAHRGEQLSAAGGANRTAAGAVLADDPIYYQGYWDPEEYTLGLVAPLPAALSLSLDATLARWSGYTTGHGERLAQPFDDVVRVALGGEWAASRAWAVRGGAEWSPTPVPEQRGPTNLLDADTLVLGLGAGVDLTDALEFPLGLDLGLTARLGAEQSVQKAMALLGDASADLPGQQIQNLGYPGFTAQHTLWQATLTATVLLDGRVE